MILMVCWLFIISKNYSYNCSQTLNIYIYHSSSLKLIPQIAETLDQEHANTAFTELCNEIIIYRKEEWFKVFIHETMHNFNLDFSNMNNKKCNEEIKKIFHVKSKIHLYESYAEFWARIINCCFISHVNTNNYTNFSKMVHKLINVEVSYSTFQMVKILDYMNLTYSEITSGFQENYSENTNILSYFVITNLLIFNYNELLIWFENNNNKFYDFKKTNKHLSNFCKLILNKYDEPIFLNHITKFEKILNHLNSSRSKKINYLKRNLRMTLWEIE